MAEYFKGTTKNNYLDPEDSDSSLNLFDQSNPDITFFNLVDDEIIKLSGSKIYYYKYHQMEQDYDDVYMEARNKTIAREPITVHGHYDPKAIEEKLTKFGLELDNDQVFTFNKPYIERKLNRAPIPGDILKPLFQNIKFEVKEVQEDSFEAYGIYHYICTCMVLRDSEPIVDENLTKVTDPIGKQNEE